MSHQKELWNWVLIFQLPYNRAPVPFYSDCSPGQRFQLAWPNGLTTSNIEGKMCQLERLSSIRFVDWVSGHWHTQLIPLLASNYENFSASHVPTQWDYAFLYLIEGVIGRYHIWYDTYDFFSGFEITYIFVPMNIKSIFIRYSIRGWSDIPWYSFETKISDEAAGRFGYF